jgi:hypothetical protein
MVLCAICLIHFVYRFRACLKLSLQSCWELKTLHIGTHCCLPWNSTGHRSCVSQDVCNCASTAWACGKTYQCLMLKWRQQCYIFFVCVVASYATWRWGCIEVFYVPVDLSQFTPITSLTRAYSDGPKSCLTLALPIPVVSPVWEFKISRKGHEVCH